MQIAKSSTLTNQALVAVAALAGAAGQSQAQQLWAKQLGAALFSNLDDFNAAHASVAAIQCCSLAP